MDASPDRAPASVLLVDDHEAVRALTRRLLDELGYDVTTASDAHGLPDVAARSADLRSQLVDAGYETLTSFRSRQPEQVPL